MHIISRVNYIIKNETYFLSSINVFEKADYACSLSKYL
jgi:hypothetical protein